MSGEPTLRHGDNEADGWVRYLQEKLLVQDEHLPTTGVFDDATLETVKDFQAARHLTYVDGVVGDETWAALRSEHHHVPGTDGLAAHTHLDAGLHLVFFDHGDLDLWYPDYDYFGATIVNVGGTQCHSGVAVYFTVTPEGGSALPREMVMTVPYPGQADPCQPGGYQWVQLDGVKGRYGAGTFHVHMELSDAVGSDAKTFQVRIDP